MKQVPPDTLILLDMSGSMNWDPSGPLIPPPPDGRRIDIARKVLLIYWMITMTKKLDGNDGKNLNARLGYMRFRESWDNGRWRPFNA